MKDSKSSKVFKEELFVGVPTRDNSSMDYHAVSSYVGEKLPYANPKSTCALRVTSDVAAFSLLFLTKVTTQALTSKNLEFPKGPLMKLEKKAQQIQQLEDGVMIVEYDSNLYTLNYQLSPSGVLTVDGPTLNFERPKSAMQVYIFFKSSIAKRVIALGFIGHLGKPGEPDNLVRVVAKVIKSATGVGNFYAISGFEDVNVPPSPRAGSVRISRKPTEKARIELPVWLFNSDASPSLLASGSVGVEVNLDVAGVGAARLLFNLLPSKELEDIFEQYRSVISKTVMDYMTKYLGENEIREIAAEIAIEDVGAGTIGRLNDALNSIPEKGINFSPTMFMVHE